MKQAYINILLFFWGFHFAIPFVYIMLFGYVNLYSNYIGYSGLIYNTLVILLATLIIWKREKISDDKVHIHKYLHAKSFFILSLVIFALKFYLGGGYEGALEGTTHGTLISFLSLFFNSEVAFFILLLASNISSPVIWVLLYVGLFTLLGSRSAILAVVFVFLFAPAFNVSTKNLFARLRYVFYFLAVLSPFLFIAATKQRGDFDMSMVKDVIVGRISFVELSSIPIESSKDSQTDYILLKQKYSTLNQIKQCINSVSPIDPFENDVAPNQYYRAIFLGAKEQSVLDHYLSMNLTFPIYSIIKTNVPIGIILSILFLVLVYKFWIKHTKNRYIFFIVLFSLYELMYFFDWVMVFQKLFTIFLTLFTLNTYEYFLNIVLPSKTTKRITSRPKLFYSGNNS